MIKGNDPMSAKTVHRGYDPTQQSDRQTIVTPVSHVKNVLPTTTGLINAKATIVSNEINVDLAQDVQTRSMNSLEPESNTMDQGWEKSKN